MRSTVHKQVFKLFFFSLCMTPRLGVNHAGPSPLSKWRAKNRHFESGDGPAWGRGCLDIVWEQRSTREKEIIIFLINDWVPELGNTADTPNPLE